MRWVLLLRGVVPLCCPRGIGPFLLCWLVVLSSGSGQAAAPPPRAGLLRDAWGDPMPPGARARLGSGRYRLSEVLAFSGASQVLSADGRNLAMVSSGGQLGVRPSGSIDLLSGRQKAFPPGEHSFVPCCFTPDGQQLFGTNDKGDTLVRDLAQGQQRLLPLPAESKGVALAVSPLGRIVAMRSPGPASELRLVDFQTGKLVRTLSGLGGDLFSAVFSPDGQRLATLVRVASRPPSDATKADSVVLLWDLVTGKEVRRIPVGASWVIALVFSPDGRSLALALDNGNCQIWDLVANRRLRSWWSQPARPSTGGYQPGVLTFAADGGTVVLVNQRERAGVLAWDVRTGQRVSLPPGPACRVDGTSVVQGRVLARGVSWQALVVWELFSGKVLSRTDGHPAAVTALGFSQDGRRLLTAGGGLLIEWDQEGRPRRQHVLERLPGPATESWYAISPGGRFVASLSNGRQLLVRDLRTDGRGRGGKRWFPTQLESVSRSLFSWDGARLAVPSQDARGNSGVRLLDVESGEEQGWYPTGEESEAVLAAFHPLGRTVALASKTDGSFHLHSWEIDGKPGHPGFRPNVHPTCSVSGFSWSPDGRYLLLTEHGGLLRLLDGRTGAEVWEIDCKYDSGDRHLPAFSPDGRSLAAPDTDPEGGGSSDRLRVFETRTGSCRWSVPLGTLDVTALAFHPDGKTLVSGHGDSSVLLWDYRDLPGGASRKPTPGELQSCWEALRKPDAREAFTAQRTLAAAGDAAVVLLRERLRPVPVVARDQVLTRLVRQLDDDSFDVRRQAFVKLQAEGPGAEPVLMQSVRTAVSPEARLRIYKLLEPLWQRKPTPDQLQALRGVEVLEWIGSPEARRVVEELARGRPGNLLTREAEATLARMKR